MTGEPINSDFSSRDQEMIVPDGELTKKIRQNQLGVTESLRVTVENFHFLRGSSASEVETKIRNRESLPVTERASLAILESISSLTQKSMAAMNQAHPGLQPDSLETTLSLITRPGAEVYVIWGRPNADLDEPEAVVGYGIDIRGLENAPESEEEREERQIPKALVETNKVQHRIIRLFVTDCAREQEAAGRAFGLIIDEVKSRWPGESIIGMVLTDLVLLRGGNNQSLDKRPWLDAKAALERRGFEDSGFGLTEVVSPQDSTVVSISFRWYSYPPKSELGRTSHQLQQERFYQQQGYQLARLAGVAAQLPLSGAVVHHIGTRHDAFCLAAMSANQVYAEVVDSSDPKANRPAKRWNLVTWAAHESLGLPPNSAGAIVINGVLPDIIRGSAPGGYRSKVANYIEQKVEALQNGGTLLIREPVAPPDRAQVDVNFEQPKSVFEGDLGTPAGLFDQFVSGKIEPHITQADWRAVRMLEDTTSRSSYTAPAHVVNEFLLKWRYSKDWSTERERPYAWQTQEERLQMGRDLGLRLVYAAPERNPFVIDQGHLAGIHLSTPFGMHLDPFPTNHLSVWQRVAPGEGIGIRAGEELPLSGESYVSIIRYENISEEGKERGIQETASRKGVTLDVVPYRIDNGRLYVWGRVFPRPLMTIHPALDGSIHGGYATEQLAGVVSPEALAGGLGLGASTRAVFERVTGTTDSAALNLGEFTRYFVRPETVDEQVVSTAVGGHTLPLHETIVTDFGLKFGARFQIRAFDAVRILQGAQVGHTEDARLERKIYELLISNHLGCGHWISDRMQLETQSCKSLSIKSLSAHLQGEARITFKRADDQRPQFLRSYRRIFTEYTADSQVEGNSRELDYVEPDPISGYSHQSLSLLPIARVTDERGEEQIVIGLETTDLPAVQEREGSSRFVTIPTARIPKLVRSLDDASRYGKVLLSREHGLVAKQICSLGGKYVVSPGVTPEVIYPFLVEVDISQSNSNSITWVPLRDCISENVKVQSAQLLTASYRALHMLGLLQT